MLSAVYLENPWSQNQWPEEDLIKASLKRAMCFEVFVDEGLEEEVQPNNPKLMNPNSPKKQTETKSQEPFVGAFKIWTEDDDDGDEDDDENDDNCSYGDSMEIKEHPEGIKSLSTGLDSRSDAETNANSSEDARLNGDSVIRRFVGSAVFDDPGVENACHHGLVDPAINLKVAMDDMNSMFGKPLNFVRANRPRKQAKPIKQKPAASQGFSILADNDLGEDSIRVRLRKACLPSSVEKVICSRKLFSLGRPWLTSMKCMENLWTSKK